jgi:two-component sensor histidine kinase/HAMP domain-containing protein
MIFNKSYKSKTIFTVTTAALLIIIGLAVVLLLNVYMKKHALIEAEAKARIITDLSLSIHTYFTHNLKPSVFKITDKQIPESYFDPAWMSSTYAVREIKKYFSGINANGYYYKECAINARSPENEADDFEKDFLRQTNISGIENLTAVREINNIPYLTILRKGETMGKNCLRCHSTPENAPADMVAYYGPDKSFSRSENEVISAISIRIPLTEAYEEANRLSFLLSGIILIILFIYGTVTTTLNKRFIFSPLEKLQNRVILISRNREKLHNTIEPEGSSEIRALTGSFNSMSLELSSFMSELEEKLKERSREIIGKNEELQKANEEKDLLLREVHHRIKNNMSIVAGLLMLQAENIDNKEAVAALEDAQRRVLSMMQLYDKLYKNSSYSSIMTADYLPLLIDEIKETFKGDHKIIIHKKIENFELKARDIFPVSIILNELVTNSFKYAFPDKGDGIITVQVTRRDDKSMEITVEDNGRGFPPDFNINESKTFGLYLVNSLAEQNNGYMGFPEGEGAAVMVKMEIS